MTHDPPRRIPIFITIGIVMSLLTIFSGFVLGTAFGANEEGMKQSLHAAGDEVLDSVYGGDTAAKDAVVAKSWVYLQRAHLHAGAIGTTSLVSIVLLILICRLGILANITAVSFGLGSLMYSAYWLLAGFKGPSVGDMHKAKESLDFLAIPGAGLCLLGVLGTLVCVILTACSRPCAGAAAD